MSRDDTDTERKVYEIADALSHLIMREHQVLQDELGRVGVLVEDAVKELNASFRDLNESARQMENKGVDAGVIDVVRQQTARMTRMLQFDDIVQQLSGHATERLKQMCELFVLLQEKTKAVQSGDDGLDTMQAMIDDIGRFRESLEKENPVRQQNMGAGSIELF